jgi:hypothetical protein
MVFSLRLIEFEAWWKSVGSEALRKTMKRRVIPFASPKMNRVSHISESIWQMDSGGNSTSDISEPLQITNMKEAYRSSNNVNYSRQMLKHYDQCTSLVYMEETLSYLALEGLYDIDSSNVINLLSATDTR